MSIAKYRLGHLDAELDRRHNYLDEETFVRTEPLEEAMDDECPFVCGRKGTGKTAVAFRIQDMHRYKHVVTLEETEYHDLHSIIGDEILSHAVNQANPHETLELLFYRIWNLVLHLCAIGSCVLGQPRAVGDAKLLEELQSIWRSINPNESAPLQLARRIINKYIHECNESTAWLADLTQALGGTMDRKKLARAREITAILSDNNATLVTIDTQERYDTSNLRVMPMRGMCRAVREFTERSYYDGLTIKCFLPAELTVQLFYDNKFKYDDNSTVLVWDYADLIEFVARRYSRFLRRSSGPIQELGDKLNVAIANLAKRNDRSNSSWRKQVWALFAPTTVRNRRGHQEDGPTYFLRHTLRRPRECLSSMNHIVRQAYRTAEFPLLSGQAIQMGIHDAENLRAIVNSALSIFRSSDAKEPLQEIVGRVFKNEPRLFDANALRNMTARAMQFFPSRNRSEVHDHLQTLLIRSGLLGVVHDKLEGGPTSRFRYHITKFEYCAPGTMAFNEASLFALHPVLADWLDLKDPDPNSPMILPIVERDSLPERL